MKKIINIAPQSIINIIFQIKYYRYAKTIHKENLEKNYIINIENLKQEERKNLNKLLSNMCKGVYNDFYFLPLAAINVEKGYDNYLQLLNSNGRSKIKRAIKKGIVCKEFIWNNYLDDIYEINTSTRERQGRVMSDEYLHYPKKVDIVNKNSLKIRYIGAFYNDKLVGYIELYIYNNFAMTNRLLGHKDYLNRYIMNAMFAYSIQYLEENNVSYLNYLTMHNIKNSSLAQFKYRLGFREYSLRVIKE